ncbi:MAG: GNAT family N-acetyltransferase [Trueperaceae bacterium]|nr:GNAT family N-acetyltransferase [Trueperaceae bacterium]
MAFDADEMRREDAVRDPKCKFALYVAERDGHTVGVGGHDQPISSYNPRLFYLNLYVDPDARGRGVGTALYQHVHEAVSEYRPAILRNTALVKEGDEASSRFAKVRGFREDKQIFESHLDVANFDPTPYEGLEPSLTAQGITFTSLKDLRDHDPHGDRKFYDLFAEVRRDVPRTEPATDIPFERFVDLAYNDDDFLQEYTLVAMDGDACVGLSGVYQNEIRGGWDNGLTGVRREYRGRGIALALKVKSITTAKALGVPLLVTDNDSTNAPMLRVNTKLGFVRQPAWLSVVWRLEPAA